MCSYKFHSSIYEGRREMAQDQPPCLESLCTSKMRNTVVVILLVLCMTTLTRVVADSFCGTGLVSCDGMSRIRRALCNGLSMCGDKLTREKREISDEDSSGSDSLEIE